MDVIFSVFLSFTYLLLKYNFEVLCLSISYYFVLLLHYIMAAKLLGKNVALYVSANHIYFVDILVLGQSK